jgi:hypothetical protein
MRVPLEIGCGGQWIKLVIQKKYLIFLMSNIKKNMGTHYTRV